MNEDLDKDYPPSDEAIIAITGSVTSGFKYWGPFHSMKDAVEWVESKQPFIGWTSISYVNKPDSHSVNNKKIKEAWNDDCQRDLEENHPELKGLS